MKSKSVMLMILSVGFGLIAAIGISQVVGRGQANAAPVQQHGTVLIAADHLDMKTHLTEENVKIVNWPISIIPEDAVTSLEEIEEMGIKVRLSKGMPIVRSAIANVKQLTTLTIPDGYKVVAIKVSGDSLVGGLLTPGDKVDVIGLFKRRSSNNQTQTTTRTFMKALRVFSVNNQMSARENRTEGGSAGSAVVGVLVTEKQSEEIYYVQRTGEIKLVLRGDYVSTDDDVEDLADIMGDWGDEPDPEPAAIEDESPKRGLFSGFGSGGDPLMQESSMIVWSGGNAEKIVFQHGSIPQSTRSNPAPPSRGGEGAEELDLDDDEEFSGSNEIDRGLDQDQYRGL